MLKGKFIITKVFNHSISASKIKNEYYRGFTLAEVLITLVIIGVVSSMTIPGLIQANEKTKFVTKLKKEYSAFSQAYNLLVQEEGGSATDIPGFSSSTGSNADDVKAMNSLAQKLKVIKNCGSNAGCWYNGSLKWLNNGIYSDRTDLDPYWSGGYGKAILADGTLINVDINSSSCTDSSPYGSATGPLHKSICGFIRIDVNGNAGPNQVGRDFFFFWISKNGIYPFGAYNDGYGCDISSSDPKLNQGEGCAVKVLTEGAMNY